jgi:hypothetical protein
MQEKMGDVEWNAINTGVIVISGLLTLASVYLRMFISGKMSALESKMSALETSIMDKIESKFSQKEFVKMQIDGHEARLLRIEGRMERIRIAKEFDDRQ